MNIMTKGVLGNKTKERRKMRNNGLRKWLCQGVKTI